MNNPCIYYTIERLFCSITKRLKGKSTSPKYSVAKIQEALNSATATLIEKDIYSISDPTNTYKEMMKEFDLAFSKKYALVEEIRKYRKKFV